MQVFFNFRDQLHVGDCSWARSQANMRARKWSREKFVGAAVSARAEFLSGQASEKHCGNSDKKYGCASSYKNIYMNVNRAI